MEFNATLIISAISFIIFTLIMNKILYKPLADIMNEREQFINDNILDTKLTNNLADEISKNRDTKLTKSINDAKLIVSNKVNEANQNSRNIVDQAKLQSKNSINSCKNDLLNTVESYTEELNSKTKELANIIYKKIME